jgi:hypothetical protein
MLVAVATVIGHNSMPHHHRTEIQLFTNYDDHHEGAEADHHDQGQSKEDDHNIFSFAQLDEDFIPSQFSKVNIDLPILYLLTPVITCQIAQLKEQSKNHFGYYREFPPPGNYLSNLFSRPPPAC